MEEHGPWLYGPPTWVGIGAMKSGTTWWHRNIIDHPDAVVAHVSWQAYERPTYVGKQLHYFDSFCHRPLTDDDVSYYHRMFRHVPGQVTGEWSPRYMYDFWTPSLLRQAAPETKILVILRDPVLRFESEMSHNIVHPVRDKHFVVHTDHELWHEDAFFKGLYSRHMQNWLRYFDRDQVLVLQYEQCVRDPDANLAKTYEFLGLDPEFRPEDTSNSNPGSGEFNLLPLRRDALSVAYQDDAYTLKKMFPHEIDLELWGMEEEILS